MKHILVADDQPHVLRGLKMVLEQEDYVVDTVSNGLAALDRIGQKHPDVLITDIAMPRMSGRELVLAIQESIPDRQFLIMVISSGMEQDEKVWIRDIRNIEFQEKPLSPKRLISRLANYFQEVAAA